MSKRADGTLRKEVKIRPGYVDPETAKPYTNGVLERGKVRFIPGRGGSVLLTREEKVKVEKPRKEKTIVAIQKDSKVFDTLTKHDSNIGKNLANQEIKKHVEVAGANSEVSVKSIEKKLRQIGILQEKEKSGIPLNEQELSKVQTAQKLLLDLQNLKIAK